MRPRAVIAAAALAALAVLGTAADALASKVGSASGGLVFVPDPGESNRLTISLEAAFYRVTDRGTDQLDDLGGCPVRVDPQTLLCTAAGVRDVSVALGDGHDAATLDVDVPATIQGDSGVDTIAGGSAPDRIFGGAGSDHVDGRGGDDQLIELDGEPNVLNGGAGSDRITGGDGGDTVHGGAGDDRLLFGGAGNDTLNGGDGDDVLEAGAGPELLLADRDRLSGGAGVDAVTYEGRAEPVRASIGDGPDDGALAEGDDVAADVERLVGSQANDRLFGAPGGDVLDGSGGADVIEGGGGDDFLDGGDEDASGDTLRGGPGADSLSGLAGGDALDGGDGDDRLLGGTDSDDLEGGGGSDTLDGGPGDDGLDGGLGPDALGGGDGEDTIRYTARRSPVEVSIDGLANDGEVVPTADGRIRTDEQAGSEGDNVDATNESVTGSQAADTVAGDATPNRLAGAAGEDFLDGEEGADALSGGGRSDTIVSRDAARDRVSCGAGFDYVIADRRDLLPGRGGQCEYVDDGSRSAPAARRDVRVRPRCDGPRLDADISPPGTRRAVPVDQSALVPVGTRVDSLDCAVRLRVATGRGRTLGGTLGRGTGALRVSQRRAAGGRLITRLTATDCIRGGASRAPQATMSRFRRSRYLRSLGRIAFPAEVRIDSAVMRPRGVATWTVDDECDEGARVTVKSGRLAVVDLAGDRTVVLGAGRRPSLTIRR